MHRPRLFFLLLGWMAALLVACGGREPAAEPTAASATSARCGDPNRLDARLNLFNWTDYMDPAVLEQFTAECGVRLVVDYYSNNEEMIAKLQVGNAGYDVVFPTDYAVGILRERGLLAEIDFANVPNIANIAPRWRNMSFDPDNRYSVPYQWGTTGIAYNTAYFPEPPTSWAVLFDPEQVCQHKGFVSMLDDERETVGAALRYLGYDFNDTDPTHQDEAAAVLIAQKTCLAGYDSDNFPFLLASDELVLAHAWNGSAVLASLENDQIAFVIPEEGGTVYMETMVIPVDAPHKYTAEVFINYILDPAVGAQITEYLYYYTPNQAAAALLSAEYDDVMRAGNYLLDDATFNRLSWTVRNAATSIFSDTWVRVRAR